MNYSEGNPILVLVRISTTGSVSTHKVSDVSRCAVDDGAAISSIISDNTGPPLITIKSNGSVVPRTAMHPVQRGMTEPGIGALDA